MIRHYNYFIAGTAAHGQTWHASGTVADVQNDIPSVVNEAMRQTFLKLTNGKAVFGQPGVGCQGPYSINMVMLERKETHEQTRTDHSEGPTEQKTDPLL